MDADKLARVKETYEGSDAEETRALYADLMGTPDALNPMGELAVNLMRACKKSERAKVYRGRKYRSASYDGKNWAMGEVCKILIAYPNLVQFWGWKEDPHAEYHTWVLYVDLPTGQVSFHSEVRLDGPDYTRDWDGIKGASAGRIINYAASLL